MNRQVFFSLVASGFLAWLCVSGLAGCGGENASGVDAGYDAGPTDIQEGEPCPADFNCAGDLVCHEGICRALCTQDSDCDEASQRCIIGLCLPAASGLCGDGVIEEDEECDDHNTYGGDGCSADCVAESGWLCQGEPSVCTPLCGNSVLDEGEACDDGNAATGDGCDPDCEEENGWTCNGEPSVCETHCGDGVQAGDEVCDDGNDSLNDSCPSGEDGPCVPATCGDGFVLTEGDNPEDCDDGADDDGDGCSADCRQEEHWDCTGEPSVCTCEAGYQDNDEDGVCQEDCDTANLTCTNGTCDDSSGVAQCFCNPFLTGTSCDYCVVFVNKDAVEGDGSSWREALSHLPSAIDTAETLYLDSGETCDVWVAQGVYYVYANGSADSAGGDNRDHTVNLREYSRVYGGFAGDEVEFVERDWIEHPTVLDGSAVDNPDNRVYHVVTGASDAVLDGFTIRNGSADGASGVGDCGRSCGGGLFNIDDSLTVSNCIFEDNLAVVEGGGAYDGGLETDFDSCTFRSNSALTGGGLYEKGVSSSVQNCVFSANVGTAGGGLYVKDSSPTVTGCTFEGNQAVAGAGMFNLGTPAAVITGSRFVNNTADSGGGIYSQLAAPEITDCVFLGNDAELGGAAYNEQAAPPTTGCTFQENSASAHGAGIYNDAAAPSISECRFTANKADLNGGAIANLDGSAATISKCNLSLNQGYRGAGIYNNQSSPTITHSVFASNASGLTGGGVYNDTTSSPIVRNCVFSTNNAGHEGGAIANWSYSSPQVQNCTIMGNTALSAGGIHNGAFSGPVMTNCILWNDTPGEIYNADDDCVPVLLYSDMQGTCDGCSIDPSNISQSPDLVDDGSQIAGTWTEVAYSEEALETVLTDDQASGWTADDLVGLLVQPTDGERWCLPVVANDETSVTVAGDLVGLVVQGDSYRFVDLRLAASSPCIDAAMHINEVTDDINGLPREQFLDPPPSGPAGAPSYPDMGAHEFVE